MGIKSLLARPYANWITRSVMRRAMDPVATQQKVLKGLIEAGKRTAFGKEHGFDHITDHRSLTASIPLRDYEGFRPYIDRIIAGGTNVLWPGRPIYLCKTSGTTSGAKYIPITKESLPNHIQSAKRALLAYIAFSGRSEFVDGKMIFLQGSPVLDRKGAIPMGRLSGIVANHVPAYLVKDRLPGFSTNSIDDWETKVEAIVTETIGQDLRLVSGIPAWVQMYFERLLDRTGKKNILEVFPSLSLFVYGGVNFEPYRSRMRALIGKEIPSVELFPASEGFIAYQDRSHDEGLLMVLDNGIYYGFIPMENGMPSREPPIGIGDVRLGVNYALVLYTNAGLWGYEIGDTVRFVSLAPPRIVVTGRTKHFTSAFGEHVIAEEIEAALAQAIAEQPAEVAEFTVAPQLSPASGLPYHEWFIEFAVPPGNEEAFARSLDKALQQRNPYYRDLITGKVLRHLKITRLDRGRFAAWMRARGMNDAQSKMPRLANDRRFVEGLE